jgi:hypothetical protein
VTISFELLRPDDLLSLTVELRNFRLDKSDPKAPRLVVEQEAAPSYLIVHFAPQSIAEGAYFETSAIGAPSFDQPPPPPDPAASDALNPPGETPARLSGPSRLVFRIPQSVKSLPLSIEALLDWSRFRLAVAPAAAMSAGSPVPPSLAIAPPTDIETALELPFRLILSPNADVGWLHALKPVTHAGRTELWHTRLARLVSKGKPPARVPVDPDPLHTIPLRALWTPGFVDRAPLPDFFDNDPFPPPIKAAMSNRDRNEIVVLTSGFNGYFVVSNGAEAPYKPVPIQASRLFLTTLGGWLSARGHWDPLPRYVVRRSVIRPGGAVAKAVALPIQRLDLSEWTHVATLGRDHYVKIVYEGYLYPFGHRASLVKVTERKFVGGDAGPVNSPVAYLRQHMYVVVREHAKAYPAAPYAHRGLEMPLRSEIRLKTIVTPEIDDPSASAIPGSSDSFWIRTPGRDFPFHLAARDLAGSDVDFTATLIFVPVSETNVSAVQQQYAASGDRRGCAVAAKRVAYADPAAGDTALKTRALYFDTQSVSAEPAFIPKLDDGRAATVSIPALEALTGSSPDIDIRLYPAYLDHGLDPNAGVFAQIDAPPPVGFTADKSGGFATPNLSVSGISARKGLVGGSPDDAAAGLIDPAAFFGDVSAKLFGTVPLKDLIPLGALGKAAADQNAPEIRTHSIPNQKHPQTVVTRVKWAPQLQNYPRTVGSSTPLQIQFEPNSALTLNATIERHLNGQPPTSSVHGALSNFLITLFGVIGLRVSSITFDSKNGSKTNVAASLPSSNPIAFLGALAFIQALADVLPPGLFGGAGPSITLTPKYVRASYTLAFPSLSVSVFALEHIALTTGLDLPYLDGKPGFEFAFASRSKPFLLTVECLGGGGFVHLIVNADGVQMVEGALEFGGEFSIDLGVASGGVHIMAGIYFQLTDTKTTLTGFVDIGGEVSVLGIVSISIDLNLSLSFVHSSQGDKVQGRATLTVSVHVFFFSVSASVSVEKSFGSGSGDPGVRQVLGPSDWAQYAMAFA